MGLDINFKFYDCEMNEIKLAEDIDTYVGRNSDVFHAMMSDCRDIYYPELQYLPHEDYLLKEIAEKHNLYLDCFFGHNAMTINDYYDWWRKYKPYRFAGWVPKYIEWLYKEKGIVPNREEDVYLYLPENAGEDEYVFCAFDGQFGVLFNILYLIQLVQSKHPEVFYFMYYFDN